jgi:hypothetical protein
MKKSIFTAVILTGLISTSVFAAKSTATDATADLSAVKSTKSLVETKNDLRGMDEMKSDKSAVKSDKPAVKSGKPLAKTKEDLRGMDEMKSDKSAVKSDKPAVKSGKPRTSCGV